MKIKNTLIIAAIFAVLAGWYMWDQKRIKKSESRKEAESRLVRPEKDKLTEVFFKGASGPVRLQKQQNQWRMTEPVATRMDPSTAEALLGALNSAKQQDPFDAKEDKLAEYGLKTPALTAEVKAASENYTQSFEVGSKTPDGEAAYARLPQSLKVFTINSNLLTQLEKKPEDLRDKRPLPINLNEATSFTLSFNDKKIEAVKEGNDWKLVQPMKVTADSNKIGELLSAWNGIKAADFVDTPNLNVDKLGLATPAWRGIVTVKGDNGPATYTMLVGNTASTETSTVKRYAMAVGDSYAFTFPYSVYTKLTPSVGSLRSKAVFTLKPHEIERAIFTVQGKPIPLERDSAGQWRFADDPQVKLDQGKILRTLSELTSLKVERFLETPPPPTTSGLDTPHLQVVLGSKDGKTTETLITGRKAEGDSFVYAQMGDKGDWIGLSERDPGSFFLTRDALVEKKLFDFTESVVSKVELTQKGETAVLKRESTGAWTGQPASGTGSFQVNGPRMSTLLYGLTALEWLRKLNPADEADLTLVKTQQLEEPQRRIVCYDADGKELGSLGIGGEQPSYVYVVRGKADYFTVDKAKMATLSDAIKAIFDTMEGKPVDDGLTKNPTPDESGMPSMPGMGGPAGPPPDEQ